MKQQAVSFRPFGGSGPLSIYWHAGPYGDAVEAVGGRGVGWFAPNGELLGVEFDDVATEEDRQKLKFKNGTEVEVAVRRGKVSFSLHGGHSAPAAA